MVMPYGDAGAFARRPCVRGKASVPTEHLTKLKNTAESSLKHTQAQ